MGKWLLAPAPGYALLARGAAPMNLGAATCYISNIVWFQPASGAGGVLPGRIEAMTTRCPDPEAA